MNDGRRPVAIVGRRVETVSLDQTERRTLSRGHVHVTERIRERVL